MASIDAAWLGMEDPTNLMMVTGVLALAGPVDRRRLRLLLDRRLKPFGRFHQRVVRPRSRGNLPHWEDDEHFEIENHLTRVALPAPGGDTQLRDVVSDLMSAPLDFSKPLWHMHVIDGYGQGSVVLARVHHSIADGVALVRVMLSLTDESPNPRPARASPIRLSTPNETSASGETLSSSISFLIARSRRAGSAIPIGRVRNTRPNALPILCAWSAGRRLTGTEARIAHTLAH
jgi:WS/DGAT/MGAT family acyltransferase